MKYLATVVGGLMLVSTSTKACPPIDPATLVLPSDKVQFQERFLERAREINGSGRCVLEGGFGRSYQKFYYSVSRSGAVQDAKNIRLSVAELLAPMKVPDRPPEKKSWWQTF